MDKSMIANGNARYAIPSYDGFQNLCLCLNNLGIGKYKVEDLRRYGAYYEC